ncbi:hypothetical protein BJX68DRAFT_168445 [Aspergillus pseudodeflectus]|uniref:Major facilitator superfamily (MFS) profile domain-containing protein n=1 Tax=Aspergillus pseudodeflectus TaxID=176178 RepID=A0ABR4JQ21_9EURO
MGAIFLGTLLAGLDIIHLSNDLKQAVTALAGHSPTRNPRHNQQFPPSRRRRLVRQRLFPPRRQLLPYVGKAIQIPRRTSPLLASVLIFLAGGIVAATAPNNSAIIVGRTLRGWGCSGTLGGSVLMTSHVAGLKLRPMLIGM